jgi:hypothetical protein
MIRYHRVDPHYWVLAKNWDDRTRNVGMYVQTCRHRVTEGLFELPKAYMAADLGYTAPQIPFESSNSSSFSRSTAHARSGG